MKIATYNPNSINARLPVLLHWLGSSQPDVACLQEMTHSNPQPRDGSIFRSRVKTT